MKKTAAILLIGLLVFNLTGYRFTVQWMQHQQNAGLEKELDADSYDESALLEITVPLSLPYYNNWSDFERYDGEIQLNGLTYKYVKRKVENGKLILKCLPNPQQQTIQKDVSDAFAQVNGLPVNDAASKEVKKVVKSSSFEYEEATSSEVKYQLHLLIRTPESIEFTGLLSASDSSPWQPPETIRS